jgi:hypothetical protein
MTEKGLPLPKATSTGTTIVGCLFKDGIVLGADTRATEGPIVADKNCEKVRTNARSFCISQSDDIRLMIRFITLQSLYDAAVQEQPPILNSRLPSYHQTWSCTGSQLEGNPAWLPR